MINISNLSYHYPNHKALVLDNLSLSIEDGKIYGLLGENGVGKTTLLGLICGILRPSQGSVSIDGICSMKRDPKILANLFYVPDEFNLPHISLKAYVRINAPFYPTFALDELNRCLKEFDMPDSIKHLDQLSLGQRKKVMLSFAIASGTKTILMDEPSNGLDIPSKAQFRKVLATAMTDERTIVISTHQVHDVEQLLDSVIIIDNHSILLDKSISQISEEYVFTTLAPGAESSFDVIYSEPSVGGHNVIARRTPDQDETLVNLEMLFNATTKGLIK